MVDIPGLPADCQVLADHMTRYGILIAPDERYGWTVTVPRNIPVDRVRHLTHAATGELRNHLIKVMRAFEIKVDILIRYQQGAWGRGDCPWSNVRYGTRRCASTMADGGCGPTSVAIILNYYLARARYTAGTVLMDRQITPLETCNHFGMDGNGRAYSGSGRDMRPAGSSGSTMMSALASLPGVSGASGASINLGQVKRKLHAGDPVLFAMSGAVGVTRDGGARSYAGGHFMVLTAHVGSGEDSRFSVLDCGASRGSAIETMSETALSGASYWYIAPPSVPNSAAVQAPAAVQTAATTPG